MKKILVVDDDAELRSNMLEILSNAGYHTVTVASGSEAICHIMADDYDIVLADLMMPGMSGLAVLAETTKHKPATKFILMTAFATVKNAVDAMKLGASDYLSKPFKIEDLLSCVGRVIEESRFEMNIKYLELESTLSSLTNSIRRTIIKMLSAAPRMRLMEITRKLGIEDHTKVVFHLKILKEAGIIEQNDEKAYTLTRQGEKTMEVMKILSDYLSPNQTSHNK